MPLARTYRIETERLVIRCYRPQDAPLLKASIDESIEHLRPWMPWASHEPEPLEKKIARLRKYRGQFDLGTDYVYGIFDPTETMLIGSTGLHPRLEGNAREIGYWINAQQLNQGYATEAVTALTKVGFEIEGLDRIEIHCLVANERSRQIPQRLGYQHEATLRNRGEDGQGNKGDAMIWSLFREDYPNVSISQSPIRAFDVMGKEIAMKGI